jgi:hypothetical protein
MAESATKEIPTGLRLGLSHHADSLPGGNSRSVNSPRAKVKSNRKACLCATAQLKICRQSYDPATMKEIRLNWVSTRKTTEDGQPVERGPWYPDTDASRRELGEILEAGLEVWGEGSHWILERESEGL